MALKSKQKYDPSKIERLAEHIRVYNDAGDPIEYEIVIDGFKAVRRTDDPDMFSLHENFVGADTKVIEINFYHGNSNTYDKHIFLLQDDTGDSSLNGIDVDQRILESVQRERKEWEHELIRQENERLKKEVAELEKEVEELENERDELINNRSPLEGVLGEFGSTLIESFIRRNPKVIASLPGGEALAGMMQDNQPEAQAVEETEVSFKAKSDNDGALSEESRAAVEFVNQLKAQFTKEEFDKVLIILHDLADDKEKIEWMIEQLQQSNEGNHEQI